MTVILIGRGNMPDILTSENWSEVAKLELGAWAYERPTVRRSSCLTAACFVVMI